MSKKQYKQLGESHDDDDDNDDLNNSSSNIINNNNNGSSSNNNNEEYDNEDDQMLKTSNNNNNNNNNNSSSNSLKSIRSPELYYVPPNKIKMSNCDIGPPLSTSPLSSSLNNNINSNTAPSSLNNSKNNTPRIISQSKSNSLQSTPSLSGADTNSNNNNSSLPPHLDLSSSNNNGGFHSINFYSDNDNDNNNKLGNSEILVIEKDKLGTNGADEDDDNFLKTIRQIKTFKFQKKHKKKFINYLLGLVPIVDWLPKYNWKDDWKGDLVAGITVGVMLIPQGMAYAMVAGLPPIYGLYSSILPVLAYCIFGTAKQLSMGPFAIISLLVLETVNGVVGVNNKDDIYRVSVSVLLAFVCGFIQMFLGLIRFGFVANFLSDPVKTGFTSGCALIIGSSQLKHIFGYSVEASNFLLLLVIRYLKDIKKINIWAFLLGLIGIVFLIGIKKINARFKLKIPGPLLVVVIFTFFSWLLKLEQRANLKVVGDIPSGFPHPQLPLVRYNHSLYSETGENGLPLPPNTDWFNNVIQLIPGSLVLVLVGFISSVSIGAKFGEKYNYTIEPNQELFSLGASDFFGSFFLSFPVGASLSRTAVNAQSGAVSQLSSLICTIIIVFSIFFLTPIVYFLPRAVLASIVIVAIIDLVEYQMVFDLWKVHRKDLLLFCISFFSTTILGILQGILIGTVTSLLMIIYRSAYPPFAVLGRLPGTEIYKNIKRVPRAETFKGIRIVRIDGSIYFANCMFIRKKLRHHEPFHRHTHPGSSDEDAIAIMTDSEAENANIDEDEPIQVVIDGRPTIGAIIIDCSSVNDIDSTGIRMLKELVDDCRKRKIVIYFASVKGYVRDNMKRGGVVDHYGADHFFYTITDAVEHHLYLLRQSKRSRDILKNSQNIINRNSAILNSSSPLNSAINYKEDGIPLVTLSK